MNINNYSFYKCDTSENKVYTFEDIIKAHIDKEFHIAMGNMFEINYISIRICGVNIEYRTSNSVLLYEVEIFGNRYKNEIKKIKRNYNINKLLC